MNLSFLLRFEKFLKGLPFIRSIPGFNTMPRGITPSNLRFYKLCNMVLTMGMLVHVSWVFLFFYIDVYLLAYINIISVGVYIFCIIINRRGYHFTSSAIMLMEIIAHQLIAVRFIGWNAGFQYYLIVTTLFPFMMPKGRWVLKSLLLVGCLFTYILMDYLFKDKTPIYNIDAGFMTYFRISNIIFSFTSMDISGAYFNVAMHETEAQLSKISSELIVAEKKATIGELATEMAHEIQNPLNFVNNFAELNEDLLKDLKEELKNTNNTEQVNILLEDLLKNSERIKTNGKRVSKIVSMLKERVKKL